MEDLRKFMEQLVADVRAKGTQHVFATQQGNCLEVKFKTIGALPPTDKLRGAIKGFTPESRLRLLKAIAKINWKRVGKCTGLCLTYPDAFIDRSFAERTQDRSQFLRDVEHLVGRRVPTLWRVEHVFRKSGKCVGVEAAHQHFVIFNAPWIPKNWIKARWAGILGYPEIPITWIEALDDGQHAAHYAAKYAAKEPILGVLDYAAKLNTMGRAWGFTRSALIPRCRERTLVELGPAQVGKALWVKEQELGDNRPESFTLLSDGALSRYCQIAGRSPKSIDG